MTVSVLVVDDSGFFRRRLAEIINSCNGLKVVGTASNGKEAIEQTLKLRPDVITMDYEMPVMDGITAVRHIMERQPTPILMLSSLTYEGARVTLDSLEAGAVDFLPKNFEAISRDSAVLRKKLSERLNEIAKSGVRRISSVAPSGAGTAIRSQTPSSAARAAAPPVRDERPVPPSRAPSYKKFSLVAIGTSTGGPVALQNVLTKLPANFAAPLVLIQHMPATFTAAFAERLNAQCKIQVKEARDGDYLRPGLALLAPGGKQLMITSGGRVKVLPGDERLTYKPCVDITFGSAANIYADKVLAVVLTGMGADGCEGARMLKQKGSVVWAQDQKSSVIYGMPMAIARAHLADEILPLDQVGSRLCEVI